ncbi:MAG: carboxypeptidase regulatory-like domain-containing protein, partial [Candidatus Aminicenantes bacterium]|nr:carboxypeptidase regulatory-like domain-containing protein [Candidatus Aminicenantes bacterium]
MRKKRILSKAFLLFFSSCLFSITATDISAQESIAQGKITVRGLAIQIDPPEQNVPVNTPTVVNTILLSTPDAQNEALKDVVVKGELRGPSITDFLTLSTLPNHPFTIPPLTLKGTYTLEDIRLERNGTLLMKAVPDTAFIHVSDVVVTEVKVRPLTLYEIRDKGIVISEQNFQVYNFTVGFSLESEAVEIEFPVLYSPQKEIKFPTDSLGRISPPKLSGKNFSGGSISPFRLEMPDLPPSGGEGGGGEPDLFPGVLVFSNDIAFLNQFFSVILIVKNNAPDGSPLALKDLEAEIILPEELREAETDPPHIPGTPIPVKCPGPDGKIGTADDLDLILAAFSGMAEFLTEGLEEGTHIVEIKFNGTLTGLPGGDTPVLGTAKGAVLVRNPQFSITVSHPSIVREGEEYDSYYTITNISRSAANLVSLTMPGSRIIGAKLLSEDRIEFETIEPGESETAKFHLLSLETGQVVAGYFQAEGAVKGSFVLTMGVGEEGIPLSPDTLVFPPYINALPEGLVYAGMLSLGEAHSIATTPVGALPSHLPYVTKYAVENRAVELAEAGQRVEYQDSLIHSVEVLALDWLGNQTPDLAFDRLRRLTTKGEKFSQEIENIFNEELANSSLLDFQKQFAENVSYKEPFFSAALTSQASPSSCRLKVTDYYQNILQGGEDKIRAVPFGEIYMLKELGLNSCEFALIGSADPNGYDVEVLGIETGSFDLSLIIPDSEGNLRQVVFRNVETQTGSISFLSVKPDDVSFVLSTDLDGDGVEDFTTDGETDAIIEPPLQAISATQDVTADPTGHAVALFFNKSVDEESSENPENYFMEKKTALGSFLQPSKRVIIVGFNNPISPFIENIIEVSDIKDEEGRPMQPPSSELSVRGTIKIPGGIVFGKVLTADGKPVPGAEMHLIETEKLRGNIIEHVTASCFSGSSGDYSFDYVRILPSHFSIEVKDPLTGKVEKVSSRISVHGQRLNIDIVMRGRGSVRGKIFEEDGITPAAEASVMAQVQTMGQNEKFITKTDSNGEFLITQVPVGSVSLTAVKGNLFGYGTAGLAAPNTEAYTELILFSVIRTAKVRGRVLENDAVTPVDNAVVTFRSSSSNDFSSFVQTDSSGVFEFEIVPVGNFTLTAISPLTWKAAGKVSGSVGEGETFECTIILRGTGTVSGKTLSFEGIPIQGVFVYVPGTASYDETDQNGEFTLSGIQVGPFSVTAVDQNTGMKVSASGEILIEGQEVRVNLIFPNPTTGGISGRVFKSDGVTLSPSTMIEVYDANYKRRGSRTTDENGNFSFSYLEANEYILVAKRGNDGGTARTSLLFPGQFTTQDVVMLGTGKVVVHVFASDGQTGVMSDVEFRHRAIKTDEFNMVGIGMEKIQVTTDADGRAEFSDILVGNFSAEASNPFSPYKAAKSGSIPHPGAEVTIDLVLKPAGKIEGTVFAPDGITPVPNAKVFLKTGSLAPMELFSDEEGKFYFDLVPSGSFTITAEDQLNGYRGQVRGSMSIEGRTLTLDVRLKGMGEVYGTVKNQGGEVIPNARVTLKSVGFPYDNMNTETDENGQFRFLNVSEGDLTLEAKDPISFLGGRAKGTLTGNGAEAEINIILEESGTIRGTVLSPDGRDPISSAQVILECRGASLGFYFTGQDGAYFFEHVPKAKFTVEVIHPASGRKGEAEGEIRYQDHEVRLDILLEGRGTVEGYFYDTTRANTVPGATVDLKSLGLNPISIKTNTDESGKFTFSEIPQAEFRLKATDPASGLMGEASGVIEYDGQTAFVNIYAEPSGSIKGKVYKSDGTTPVPHALVDLFKDSHKKKSTAADPNGEFSFSFVPLGNYNLIASDQANRDKGKASTALNINQEEVFADVMLNGLGTVQGKVLDAASNPLPDINVKLKSRTEYGTETFSTSTNSLGEFGFSSIRVGTFSLEAKDPLSGLGASDNGEIIGDGQVLTLDLILEPSGAIEGRVFHSDGVTPAENATIQIKGQNTLYASSDNNGNFRFDSVRLGAFTLTVQGLGEAGLARIKGNLQTHGETLTYDPIVLDDVGPFVSEVSPPDGSKDVPFTTSVVITFSEEMEPASINKTNITLNGSAGSVPGNLSLSADGKTAAFVPSTPLQSFALYTIVVMMNVEDKSGHHMLTDFSSSFLTLDNIPPQILNSDPFSSQTQVALSAVIAVTLSEPVNPDTVNPTNVQVLKAGAPIGGGISLVNSQTKILFTPDALEANLEYSIFIKDLSDLHGNTQQAPFISTFKTVDTIVPAVTLIPPAGGTEVKEGVRIEVTADTGEQTDISKIHFFINGILKFTDSLAPYVYTFNAPYIEEMGTNNFLLAVTAVDFAGNQSAEAGLTFTLLPDTPPQITMTGPAGTDIYPRQDVTCHVTASDDVGLVKIDFTAQGGNLDHRVIRNLVPSQPNFSSDFYFSIPFDMPAGTAVNVSAEALDTKGNSVKSSTLILHVPEDSSPPEIHITSPSQGDTFEFQDMIDISAEASDDISVLEVKFYVDDELIFTDKTPPYTAQYQAPAYEQDTDIRIKAEAIDGAGNVSSDEVTVTIKQLYDPEAPVVEITCPTDGSLLPPGYNMHITAQAEDDVAVASVEFYINDQLYASLENPPYETDYLIPVDSVDGDSIGVKAVVYDFDGKQGQDTVTVTVLSGVELADGTVIEKNNTDYENQNIIIKEGTVTINGAHTFRNVLVLGNGILSHSGSTTTETHKMELTIIEKLVVTCGGRIDVTGKGYLGGWRGDNSSKFGRTRGNTTTGGSEMSCGGSYGGYGGLYSTTYEDGNEVNDIYGSLYHPTDPGSGGGGWSAGDLGGNGGGVIRIEADEIVLDGKILANGDNSDNHGGGSGGSIRMNAGTLRGSGWIEANGADSSARGAGGGGRIAVTYDDISQFTKPHITAYGGTSSMAYKTAAAGTVYLKKSADTEGEIIIDNNNTSSDNGTKFYKPQPGTITSLEAYRLEDINASFIPGSLNGMELVPHKDSTKGFTVISNTETAITIDPADGDMTLAAQAGDEYDFKYSGSVIVSNTHGGEVFSTNAVFTGDVVINNSRVTVDKGLQARSLTLSNGSVLSHPVSTTTAASFLWIKTESMEIDSTSQIDATGKGYLGGWRGDNSSKFGRTRGNTT